MLSNSQAGLLYVCATPIGDLNDISERCLSVLSTVDLIAAEDTRDAEKRLKQWGIKRPLLSLEKFNEASRCETIRNRCLSGQNIALISVAAE